MSRHNKTLLRHIHFRAHSRSVEASSFPLVFARVPFRDSISPFLKPFPNLDRHVSLVGFIIEEILVDEGLWF